MWTNVCIFALGFLPWGVSQGVVTKTIKDHESMENAEWYIASMYIHRNSQGCEDSSLVGLYFRISGYCVG